MHCHRLAASTLGLLLAALPSGPQATALSPEEGLPVFRAPLRAGILALQGKANFRSSPAEQGAAADAFDGRTGTGLRTRGANPGFLEVAFPSPREVLTAEVYFPGGAPHAWSLLAGEDADHLRALVEDRRVAADSWSGALTLPPGFRARVFRVEARCLAEVDSVRFGEIVLMADQRPERVEVSVPSTVVCPDGSLPVRARISWDGGYRSSRAHGLRFEDEHGSPLRLEPAGVGDPATVIARYEKSGPARVRTVLQGGNGRLDSPWVELDCRTEGLPDWSVGWIERTPRLPADGPRGGFPAEGSTVTWRAHIRNCGTVRAPRVPIRWEVDGTTASEGWLEGIDRFREGTAELPLPWDGKRHAIRCVVDRENTIPEISEGNNERTVASDALLLGLAVERPLYDRFPAAEILFGDGADGFEDWAQRQVDRWNRMLAGAVFPLTPKGVTDRIALDRVFVAEEGASAADGGLPDGERPEGGDATLDLSWCLSACLLETAVFRRAAEKSDDNPLWFDGGMIAALGLARGLADLGRLDVRRGEVLLRDADGIPVAGSPTLPHLAGGFLHRTGGGYGPHQAFALQRLAGRRNPPAAAAAHPGDLPRVCGIRVTGPGGKPLPEVRVRAWRRVRGPDGAEVFDGDPMRAGATDADGRLDLSPGGRDPFFEGDPDRARDPGQGVLLLECTFEGRTAYRFLEVVPFNLAFWAGRRDAHHEDISLDTPR